MVLLEGVADLSLAMLNRATQTWDEPEHDRKLHSEIGQTTARSFPRWPLDDAGLSRRRGSQARLHLNRATRPAQERPNHRCRGPPLRGAARYRHAARLEVHLIDERAGDGPVPAVPEYKARNADGCADRWRQVRPSQPSRRPRRALGQRGRRAGRRRGRSRRRARDIVHELRSENAGGPWKLFLDQISIPTLISLTDVRHAYCDCGSRQAGRRWRGSVLDHPRIVDAQIAAPRGLHEKVRGGGSFVATAWWGLGGRPGEGVASACMPGFPP